MPFGICNLSIVPLRFEPSNQSEMVSQVLFGEHFTVLEKIKDWSKIRLGYDNYEGWIDTKQFLEISEEIFFKLQNTPSFFATELIDFVMDNKQNFQTIPLGTNLPFYSNKKFQLNNLDYTYDGPVISGKQAKDKIVEFAYKYLNSPYLWGGKTPFGIDCSGLTQMVYKLNGYSLLRDAAQQASQGEALSFIEESEPGDLAFFDNIDGKITHVGIIMKDNFIIHAHGKVRIDRIDHSGIFNVDTKRHTHKLRVIKKII